MASETGSRPSARRTRAAAWILGAVLLAAGTGVLLWRAWGSTRPDIVLIVWDTCGADRLSAYGYGRPTTPFLDAFARTGVLYRHAYAPAPWTSPSHASLFTGLFPSHHGLTQAMGKSARVRPGLPLLSQTLAAAGYETACFTCNPFIAPGTGLDRGFATMVPLYHGEEGKGKGTGAEALRAIGGWLEGRRKHREAGRRPLFVFVNLMEAHLPRDPSAASLDSVRDPSVRGEPLEAARRVGETEAFFHSLGVRRVPAPVLGAMGTVFDGTCLDMDGWTREILARLRAGGLGDGALVAITSDHGEALGEHGELGHGNSLYDTMLHVPLVVRWPGRLDGGRVEDAQVRLQDLYPTLLDAAGVEAPPGTGLDAASLAESPLRPRAVLAEFPRPPVSLRDLRRAHPEVPEETFRTFSESLAAVQDPIGTPGARKYIRASRDVGDGSDARIREELYDLLADPGEERDLLDTGSPGDERDSVRRLRAVADSLP